MTVEQKNDLSVSKFHILQTTRSLNVSTSVNSSLSIGKFIAILVHMKGYKISF